MKKKHSYLFFIAFFSSILLAGCADKIFFPTVTIRVNRVEPYNLIPTSTNISNLPNTSVSIVATNNIQSMVEGYSIRYFTTLGEELRNIAINFTPYQMKIEVNEDEDGGEAEDEETPLEMSPYTKRVVDIFELSASNITPIRADITIYVEDTNGNHTTTSASCLLHKYEAGADVGGDADGDAEEDI